MRKDKLVFTTRMGTPDDLPCLKQLYVETILNVCSDYSQEQRTVWSAGVENEERWEAVIRDQFVLLALSGGEVVGFATLEKSSHIDLFFVHKDFQGRGIAALLYSVLESQAVSQGCRRLTGDISRTAKPFFESRGFQVELEQNLLLGGVAISNFKMYKDL